MIVIGSFGHFLLDGSLDVPEMIKVVPEQNMTVHEVARPEQLVQVLELFSHQPQELLGCQIIPKFWFQPSE